MKKLSLAFFALWLSFSPGCKKAVSPVDVEAEKALITAVLDKYVAAVEQEDMDLYAGCVVQEADMTNFGAMGEPIHGWDGLKQVIEGQNAALSETKIGVGDIKTRVSGDGLTAWATSLWDLTAYMGESQISLPVRCTWVLEKGVEGWKIIHFHKSVAMK